MFDKLTYGQIYDLIRSGHASPEEFVALITFLLNSHVEHS